ncbi:EamA family transporter [bacterium]|jgi:drug/metabolite transporter (DMT)-like permease|nr:EamA family transporter [bacterium]MBT4121688.1 EamA family transporter [bacterium]MBT4335340.1 EamA family transporter [bacterium]MBT4495918.1 EamA family transporter [bacterium]MBT4764296.1 EamA family transporter [bacterium]
MNQKSKGILLVLSTALISGVAIFINQFGVKVISPDIYTFLKNLIAGLFVLAIIIAFKEWHKVKLLKKKDWLTLAIIGLVGGSIPFLLFFKGLSLSTSGNASMIHKSMFLFVAIMAVIFLKEKLNKLLIAGILVILIGNVLLLKLDPGNLLSLGDSLILIATLFWAGENIISKKAVSTISPRIVAASRMFFGSFFIFIYLLFTKQVSLLSSLSFEQFTWTLLTGFILTLFLITWYSGIKYIKISTATCILALGAPITNILSLIQGKTLVFNQYIGLFIIIFGIALVIVSSKKKQLDYEGL